jgi:hypothetical protein
MDSIEQMKHARQHTNALPLGIIPKHTERVIYSSISDNVQAFIDDMVSFGMVCIYTMNNTNNRHALYIMLLSRRMVQRYVAIIDCFSKRFVMNVYRSWIYNRHHLSMSMMAVHLTRNNRIDIDNMINDIVWFRFVLQ